MAQPTLVDRPELSEIFADVLYSVSTTAHGNVRIELGTARLHQDQTRSVVCVGRIVLEPLAAARLRDTLANIVDQLTKDGVLRPPTKQ